MDIGDWVIVAVAVAFWVAFTVMIWRSNRKWKVSQGEWKKWRGKTEPCPHCLGTGRKPKEGYEWTEEAETDFEKRRQLDQIPVAFKEAWKR